MSDKIGFFGIHESNPEAPHRAVIWVHAEVHEMLPTGECAPGSSHVVSYTPIKFIDGECRDVAIAKLEEFLKELKAQCSKQ